MTGKREARLAQLARALATLDDAALLDAWKEAVAIREAGRATGRSGDEPGLRATVCEDVAAAWFGTGRHVALYATRHGLMPRA